MNYQIHLRTDPGYEAYTSLAASAAQAVLEFQNAPEGAVSIVLTSSEYIAHLNATYRDQPGPTDVLSFPDGDKDPETRKIYFGDVVIAVPEALEQAEEGGHSVEAELRLLVVHGLLHLLGFSHDEDLPREKMWAIQAEVLSRLENEITEPVYYFNPTPDSSPESEAQ
ncbi:MAG: rRNA maturation RNase YbeY [Anaerolineales bacterium]|nr:rRNA maturation RNase YbeY [Anaerolineales bacterium]